MFFIYTIIAKKILTQITLITEKHDYSCAKITFPRIQSTIHFNTARMMLLSDQTDTTLPKYLLVKCGRHEMQDTFPRIQSTEIFQCKKLLHQQRN